MTVRTPGSGAEAAVWSDYHRARRRAARRCIGHGSTQERSYSVLRCRRRRRRRRGGGRAAARKAVASSFAQLGPSDTGVVAQKPSFVIVVTCGDTLCVP